jgi:hypothetical protein
MRTALLFGLTATELDDGRAMVEGAVGLRMELHDSSFYGGDYFRGRGPGDEELILRYNYDDLDDEWTEPDHAQYPLLLLIDTPRAAELQRALEGLATLLSTADY